MMTRIISILFVILIVTSCSSIPKDEILKDARDSFAKAKANPATANLEVMYDADKALQKAENSKDADEMKHLAFIAKKKAEMALIVAKRKEAEFKYSDLLKQKEQIGLQDRKKEISSKEMDLKATQTARGLVFTLGDVLFETGKSTLLSAAQKNINKIAKFLNQYPKRNVLIGGYTDNRGNNKYNLGLSQRRADEVRFSLMQNHVASNRIQSQGFGKNQPIANNSSISGRQQNRRVEITILNEGVIRAR
ncbi:MAG: OmpA family protein [Proteobacteria bacterium]|nr:OmpA family protein [Pseudomonadota bacterium]